MDDEQEERQDAGSEQVKQLGRTWTVRCGGQLRYRRFSDRDGGGRPSIFFKFELAPGQSQIPPEVWDILRETKFLPRKPEHGGGYQPIALTFSRYTKHERLWRLPDTPAGRTAADVIDARLSKLAVKLDNEADMGR